jgi:hypothetical protein
LKNLPENRSENRKEISAVEAIAPGEDAICRLQAQFAKSAKLRWRPANPSARYSGIALSSMQCKATSSPALQACNAAFAFT